MQRQVNRNPRSQTVSLHRGTTLMTESLVPISLIMWCPAFLLSSCLSDILSLCLAVWLCTGWPFFSCYCKTINLLCLSLIKSGCVWKYMQGSLLREGVQRLFDKAASKSAGALICILPHLISTVKCSDKTSEVFIMCHIFALSASVPGLLCLFLYHKPHFLLLTLLPIHPPWLCVFRKS